MISWYPTSYLTLVSLNTWQLKYTEIPVATYLCNIIDQTRQWTFFISFCQLQLFHRSALYSSSTNPNKYQSASLYWRMLGQFPCKSSIKDSTGKGRRTFIKNNDKYFKAKTELIYANNICLVRKHSSKLQCSMQNYKD